MIGSSQDQPDSQDPLGLTRAQWEADPRQADPVATQFDTRKTIDQLQGGATRRAVLRAETTLRVTATAARGRSASTWRCRARGATSSGGVVDLDRDYGGLGARLIGAARLPAARLRSDPSARTATAGRAAARLRQQRRQPAHCAATRTTRSSSADVYAQARVDAAAGVVGHARASARAAFTTTPPTITSSAGNPDDSGTAQLHQHEPGRGGVWHAADTLNVYASYGQGFETPTFAELAYRPVGTGPQLRARRRDVEVGRDRPEGAAAPQHRVNVAVFGDRYETTRSSSTRADRRAHDLPQRGRTHAPRRRGARGTATAAPAFTAHATTRGCRPNSSDPFVDRRAAGRRAGRRAPAGRAAQQAYGAIDWTPRRLLWLQRGGRGAARRPHVRERSQHGVAPAYTIGNARVGFAQRAGTWTCSEYVRVNNVTDLNYVGSVIVGDTNGRFFEPAPGRNWFAGVSVNAAF